MDQWPQRKRLKELVAAYRAETGATRKDLSEVLGIAESTLNNFLYNQQLTPGKESMRRLASFFNVSITELMDNPGVPIPGIESTAFKSASETDRAMVTVMFRDLVELSPLQKEIAFEFWQVGIKALKAPGAKRRKTSKPDDDSPVERHQ